ncbi:MAG: aminofutalosine synthase MqnE [Ignavibacteriae bacterium]|nr:aminofutalosine synthase MqnE [Ignavibacteriota bacterium]
MNVSIQFRDKFFIPIWQKIQNGNRLSLEDGVALYNTNDIISLGKMAHFVQQQKSGDAVYFVLNRKIEPTNICVLSCKFCDFATKPGRPDAYEMTNEDIWSKLTPDLHEVHITGGMPAHWGWEHYLEMLSGIKEKFPEIDIKAFTAVEIDFFAKKFRMSIEEVLRQLKEVGLRTMPGGGAEVFSERVRRLLFNQKIGAKRWLEIHRIAHRMGIPTNATLLYGHIETIEERIVHFMKLRELQDETGGFLSFIPLAFQPGDTGIKAHSHFTSAIDDLKTIAISRLMLDNFPHIKAYWVMLTEEVASVALNFGADDMDGTVGEEHIAHDAGAITPMQLAKNQIIKIINDAGKIPVERDVYYNPINVYTDHVIGKIPYLNSVPFYHHFEKQQFKILPINPRRMGLLSEKGQIDAGLFSLMDYFQQESHLALLPWCIATRDQVKSVMLFSNHGWGDLDGKLIGVTDETATSVRLLQVLLGKRYGVRARFERLHAGVNDYSAYDAVLLIGDEALRRNKFGLAGFELVFDLAREWYEWQKLPFVFAVWAVKKSLPEETKKELSEIIGHSLSQSEPRYAEIGELRGKEIGLNRNEVEEYLAGFNYRLGEREKEAMREFKSLAQETESVNIKGVHHG